MPTQIMAHATDQSLKVLRAERWGTWSWSRGVLHKKVLKMDTVEVKPRKVRTSQWKNLRKACSERWNRKMEQMCNGKKSLEYLGT